MEDNTTIIAVGATAVILVITFILYSSMGCNVSSKVNSSADDDKKAGAGKKGDEKNKYPAGPLTVFFGSQTGTAEGFARMIMEETKEKGFNTKVIDLEDFEPDILLQATERAIFLMATYGEGEPTDNAVSFTKWLKNEDGELDSSALAQVKYSVFGLGNKQYEHYNAMGRLVNTRMEELGAVSMFEYGEGDDDATLEEDFEAWKTKLVPALYSKFHPVAAAGGGADADAAEQSELSVGSTISHKVKLQFLAQPAEINNHDQRLPSPTEVELQMSKKGSSKIHASTKHFFTAPRAKVLVSKELRNTSADSSSNAKAIGSTLHIEIDLKKSGVSYVTADNLAILPENNGKKVAALAKAQGYDLKEVFAVTPVPGEEDSFKLAFPSPCTVEEALTLFLDIQGPAKLGILKHLVAYVQDDDQKAWLAQLLDKNNRSMLHSLHNDEALSIFDLLTGKLSSCKIPWVDFLHIVPYIQPRYYTISSSSSCFPDTVHITVSITEYDLKSGREFVGLTSSYLRDLRPSGKPSKNDLGMGDRSMCRIFVRPSTFRLPASLSTPIIMIGPGTGLAPMRALLQERKFQLQQSSNGKPAPMGSNVLYFGCRQENVDYIYKDEMQDYIKDGILTSLYTAFSREPGQPKVYVQNLMAKEQNAKELIDLITKQGAYIYVCGATAMGTDVNHCFLQLLQQHGVCQTEAAATAYMKNLHDQGRYVQELWTA